MLKVLINAYAVSPNIGSEPGMAWNWCVNLAKYCELFIITEGEFEDKIETVVPTLEQGKNMHFYFNPVSEKVRRMCWNQGDWRFYRHYWYWQKKTADIARDICKKEKIDVLHQLNMIGFREPGYLWKVSKETGIPFVWGPVGGLKQFPLKYVGGGSLKMKLFLVLKNYLNIWQLKYKTRVEQALKQASLIISSIPDSQKAIKTYKGLESVIIPETGTFAGFSFQQSDNRFYDDYLTVLWIGKFDFRKRLDLAIAALATIANPKILLKVFGTGNEEQQRKAQEYAKRLGVEDCIQWLGNCPNTKVMEEMQKADLFLFTSVNEDTSTVVLEAVSNHLPVLCFDACGMSAVVTDDVGIKIPLSNPEQSVKDFAEKIDYLYHHRDVLKTMSDNCKLRAEELSWENKAKQMVALYDNVLKKRKLKK